MKAYVWIVLTVALAGASASFGQEGSRVSPTAAAEAKKMAGTNAVIVGKVAEVNKTDKLIRLNFEEKFPKQVFTAVVFSEDFANFPKMESVEGKTVMVCGKVVEYQGKPQIVLRTRGQLHVVEAGKEWGPESVLKK